jgi:hypothetical protein
MNQKQYEKLLSTWEDFCVPNWAFWNRLKEDRLVFVTEVGDARSIEDPRYPIFVKGILSRDYVREINDQLKAEGKSIIRYATSERSIRSYIGYIFSRDFRFIHEVELRTQGWISKVN